MATPAPIPEYVKDRFNTLLRAAQNGDLALVSALDTGGAQRYLLCAVSHDTEGGVTVAPFGEVNASDNPYDDYQDPTQD